MDTAQIVTLVTGSGGALVFAILWIRYLQGDKARLENLLDEKDKQKDLLSQEVVRLATDIQRSMNEQSGCRYPKKSNERV